MEDPSRPVTGYPAPNYPPAQPCTIPNGHPPAHPSYAAAGTAYPYAANPYAANPYYSSSQPYPNRNATVARRIMVAIIALCVGAGTAVLILWFVLRPRIPEFRVDSLTLSNFGVNSSSLVSGNWDVGLTVRNPNRKIRLHYDHIEAIVFYRSEALATTFVPPFDQDTKNQTAVRASFAAASTYVDGWVVNSINQEKTRGTVSFNVGLNCRVRFKAGAWQARRRYLRVYCGNLPLAIGANGGGGNLTGGPRQCRVGV